MLSPVSFLEANFSLGVSILFSLLPADGPNLPVFLLADMLPFLPDDDLADFRVAFYFLRLSF